MKISLNGDPFDLPAPVTVSELLVQLQIDPRRVAIEHNLVVLKRNTFDTTTIAEGDQVEIVNFVGGGEAVRRWNLDVELDFLNQLRGLGGLPDGALKSRHG